MYYGEWCRLHVFRDKTECQTNDRLDNMTQRNGIDPKLRQSKSALYWGITCPDFTARTTKP